MKKTKKIQNGKVTYVDEQSLGETHDMIVKALPGQSYVKETMHKISTTQVTGEAIKKISVGGKGGMASGSDARDSVKEVDVTTRVMVLSDPSQTVFDHNASLEKKCVGFDDKGKPIYVGEGESYIQKIYDPSHLFGDNKNIKGDIEFTRTHGRDFDEFSHSNNLDPSDHQQAFEMTYLNEQFLGLEENITLKQLEALRERYDYICGYVGAWKYVGVNGAEHRRYTIHIENTLNFDTKKPKKEVYQAVGWQWDQEMPHSHHISSPYFATNNRRDNVQFMMEQFDRMKPYIEQTRVYDPPIHEKSEEFLQIEEAGKLLERKRRLDALKGAPKLEDWKIVYKWECTKQGKIMFLKK